MMRCVLRRMGLPALFGMAFGVISATPGQAVESRTYIISASSGYGVEDCLGDGGECGAVVADAWCRTYGEGVAQDFGRSQAGDPSERSWPASKRYFVVCAPTEAR